MVILDMQLYCLIFYTVDVDDPLTDPNTTGDPYKTLFVARLVSYCASYYQFFNIVIRLVFHNGTQSTIDVK